jgi:hypothetical protein
VDYELVFGILCVMHGTRGDPTTANTARSGGRFDLVGDGIVATVTWLCLVDLDRCDGDDPAQALSCLARVTSWCDALRARAVVAAGRVGTAGASGARDTADVVAATGVSTRESRRQVRLAEKLVDLPVVADALERGDVSVGHVEAITRAMDTDPAVAAAAIASQDELIGRAAEESVDEFVRSQKEWAARVAEAAGVSLDARRRGRRRTSFFEDELGMRALRASMTPEEGAIVERGVRTLVDEFVRLSRGAKADRAVSPLEHTRQLMTDALVEMARRSQAGGSGRSLPHVIVHVDALTLQSGVRHDGSVLRLDDGTPIGFEAVQRVLCDAAVTGVLFANLVTLAKGRTIRTANDDHWDVLRARDGGCVFPECSMPPDYCQAHHIRHWTAHHGVTDPDNLVLVCSKHHHLVHEGGWSMKGPAHAVQIVAANGQVFWTRTGVAPAAPTPARRRRKVRRTGSTEPERAPTEPHRPVSPRRPMRPGGPVPPVRPPRPPRPQRRDRPPSGVPRGSGQGGVDGGAQGGVVGADRGAEPGDDVAVTADHELLEVPADVAVVTLGVLLVDDCLVDGMALGAVDVDLGGDGKRHVVVGRAEVGDLVGRAGLLAAELIAREADHGEAAVTELVLQRLKTGVLRRQAALGRDVHEQRSLAVEARQQAGLAVEGVDVDVVDAHGISSRRGEMRRTLSAGTRRVRQNRPMTNATEWESVGIEAVQVGDRIRLGSGAEFDVARIDSPFLGRDNMVCLIEDTPERWMAHPQPKTATAEVQRAAP